MKLLHLARIHFLAPNILNLKAPHAMAAPRHSYAPASHQSVAHSDPIAGAAAGRLLPLPLARAYTADWGSTADYMGRALRARWPHSAARTRA